MASKTKGTKRPKDDDSSSGSSSEEEDKKAIFQSGEQFYDSGANWMKTLGSQVSRSAKKSKAASTAVLGGIDTLSSLSQALDGHRTHKEITRIANSMERLVAIVEGLAKSGMVPGALAATATNHEIKTAVAAVIDTEPLKKKARTMSVIPPSTKKKSSDDSDSDTDEPAAADAAKEKKEEAPKLTAKEKKAKEAAEKKAKKEEEKKAKAEAKKEEKKAKAEAKSKKLEEEKAALYDSIVVKAKKTAEAKAADEAEEEKRHIAIIERLTGPITKDDKKKKKEEEEEKATFHASVMARAKKLADEEAKKAVLDMPVLEPLPPPKKKKQQPTEDAKEAEALRIKAQKEAADKAAAAEDLRRLRAEQANQGTQDNDVDLEV